jgi:transcriptional regulator with XRE-family HTH domain
VNRATQIRLDKGLKIEDVVAGAQIGPRTLAKIESGTLVRAASLARLAAFYGLDRPSALMGPAIFDGERAA